MNAADAKRLGIQMGDTVEVWNDRGKVVAVLVSPDAAPRRPRRTLRPSPTTASSSSPRTSRP